MKCVMTNQNARAFAKAIQSLAKIGTEIFIEASSNSLSVRTLNATKSALAVFKFFPDFFTDFQFNSEGPDKWEKYGVSVKSCIDVFKNMKTVDFCTIQKDDNDSNLSVKFKCRLDTVKTYSISLTDVETVHTTNMNTKGTSKIIGDHKLFSEMLTTLTGNNFWNEEEITFYPVLEKFIAQNYIDGVRLDGNVMRSKLALNKDEFIEYRVTEESQSQLVFCLREFRALLSFAEFVNLPLAIHFKESGQPIVFVIENNEVFKVTLVISTLHLEEISTYDPNIVSHSAIPNNDTICENVLLKRKSKNDDQTESKKCRYESQSNSKGHDFINLSDDHNEENEISNKDSTLSESILLKKTSKKNIPEKNQSESYSNSVGNDFVDLSNDEIQEDSNRDSNSVNKDKVRLIFRRCFETTYNPREMSRYNEILEYDSDVEN